MEIGDWAMHLIVFDYLRSSLEERPRSMPADTSPDPIGTEP
jgi:hypothetical protein